ncbi:MAG TPA: type II toxin-antitoxin system HigB family toxin [Allosphingosinicella sp.]|jgi:hypothetical protein|uniref:type II toxin-antitoxin system HigB family toxin n=1 Tax=Allosphingosinicella sp. TaxID=2823234 RepID=UPI002F2A801E
MKRHYVITSIVSADRTVFNIKGNDYRLVVAVDLRRRLPGSNGSQAQGSWSHPREGG